MKYFNPNKFENMMLNIVTEGERETWEEIEKEKDALKRCELRMLYSQAIKKIKSSKEQSE